MFYLTMYITDNIQDDYYTTTIRPAKNKEILKIIYEMRYLYPAHMINHQLKEGG